MKLLGIIAEYNPFHKGHAYHIAEAKKQSGCDAVMVMMSGSCVQRGEFAIADKWTRARTAVENGADLVCELPFVYAAQTAEIFASGGVALLDAAQCKTISFGIENKNGQNISTVDEKNNFEFTNHFDALKAIADLLSEEPPIFQSALKKYLSEGFSFAASRQKALSDCNIKSDCLSEPNNILAVEYLKAVRKQNCIMTPCPILRYGENYRSKKTDGEFISAAAIRKALIEKQTDHIHSALPYSAELFDIEAIHHMKNNYELLALAELFKSTPESLRNIPDATEGLEFALINAIKNNFTLQSNIDAVCSKRIPKSRIQRILLHLTVGYTKNDFQVLSKEPIPYYYRVLAFNKKGREIIKHINHSTDIPVITNVHSNRTRLNRKAWQALQWDCRVTDLFELLSNKKNNIHADYYYHPLHI